MTARTRRDEIDDVDAIGLGRVRPAPRPDGDTVRLDELAAATGDPKYVNAAAAEELLANPLFVNAIAAVKGFLTREMLRSKPGAEGQVARDEAHGQITALDAVVHLLQRTLREGQLTQAGGSSGGS